MHQSSYFMVHEQINHNRSKYTRPQYCPLAYNAEAAGRIVWYKLHGVQFCSECDSAARKKGETAQGLSLNPDVNCDMFFVSRPIKNDLVSSWDGLSKLSQITVMFVVNLKKSYNATPLAITLLY